jgi:hypothetical protein
MDLLEALWLAIAAFAAGAVNAVAGGGSLISFPALLAAGYSAKVANVTNTVALMPGYFGGALGYREELRRQRRRILVLAIPCVLGAIAGAALLLSTSEDTFEIVVPFLILFACLLMIFQERLSGWAQRHQLHSRGGDHVPVTLIGAIFLCGIYGGYFGAALGIMMIALLTILLPDDIQHSNALKTVMSTLINSVAAVYFMIFGPVEWGPAAVMAVAALGGGYLGAGIARRLGSELLKRVIIVIGLIVTAVLFADLLDVI